MPYIGHLWPLLIDFYDLTDVLFSQESSTEYLWRILMALNWLVKIPQSDGLICVTYVYQNNIPVSANSILYTSSLCNELQQPNKELSPEPWVASISKL